METKKLKLLLDGIELTPETNIEELTNHYVDINYDNFKDRQPQFSNEISINAESIKELELVLAIMDMDSRIKELTNELLKLKETKNETVAKI